MRYLVIHVVCEGGSDLDFLPIVVQRSLQDLCNRHVATAVDIDLHAVVAGGDDEMSRADWVVQRAEREAPDLLLFHVDGSADEDREIRKSYEPVRRGWRRVAHGSRLVPLVPVREMEAWAMADLDVLEEVVSTVVELPTVYEGHLLARPQELSDPKRTLKEVAALGRRPRRKVARASTYLPLLAELVPLSSLRKLTSFQKFEEDILAELDQMGWSTP